MQSEFVSTYEATKILGHEGAYHRVHWLVKSGQLTQIEISERKRVYRRDAVEKIAKRLAPFQKRAA